MLTVKLRKYTWCKGRIYFLVNHYLHLITVFVFFSAFFVATSCSLGPSPILVLICDFGPYNPKLLGPKSQTSTHLLAFWHGCVCVCQCILAYWLWFFLKICTSFLCWFVFCCYCILFSFFSFFLGRVVKGGGREMRGCHFQERSQPVGFFCT